MVLVTTKMMITMMEIARELKMVETDAQWFYVVSDTNYRRDNISMVSPLIDEGNNIAFVYNFTRSNDECVSGIKCHANELLKSFVLGLSRAIREENAIYQQISDEEWEIVRPSKRQRRAEILEFMLEDLLKTSKCSNCTTWRVSRYFPTREKFSCSQISDKLSECSKLYFVLFFIGSFRSTQPISGEIDINIQCIAMAEMYTEMKMKSLSSS
jgi:hypothetical protein